MRKWFCKKPYVAAVVSFALCAICNAHTKRNGNLNGGACNCFDVCRTFKIQFKHTCEVLAKTVQAEIKKCLFILCSSFAWILFLFRSFQFSLSPVLFIFSRFNRFLSHFLSNISRGIVAVTLFPDVDSSSVLSVCAFFSFSIVCLWMCVNLMHLPTDTTNFFRQFFFSPLFLLLYWHFYLEIRETATFLREKPCYVLTCRDSKDYTIKLMMTRMGKICD